MGGVGVISVFGNAFPDKMAWLVKHALNGDALNARKKMEDDFNNLFHLMFVDGNPSGEVLASSAGNGAQRSAIAALVPVSEHTERLIGELARN